MPPARHLFSQSTTNGTRLSVDLAVNVAEPRPPDDGESGKRPERQGLRRFAIERARPLTHRTLTRCGNYQGDGAAVVGWLPKSVALQAELVALRIGKHNPAATLDLSAIVEHRGAESDEPLQFG